MYGGAYVCLDGEGWMGVMVMGVEGGGLGAAEDWDGEGIRVPSASLSVLRVLIDGREVITGSDEPPSVPPTHNQR